MLRVQPARVAPQAKATNESPRAAWDTPVAHEEVAKGGEVGGEHQHHKELGMEELGGQEAPVDAPLLIPATAREGVTTGRS